MEIGDYVLIKKEAEIKGGYAKISKDEGYPLYVYSIDKDYLQVYTRGLHINGNAQNPFSISENDVHKLTQKEYKKIVNNLDGKFKEEVEERTKVFREKHISINKRKDYNISSKVFIDTSFNFVNTYPKNTMSSFNGVVPNLTAGGSRNYMAVCCSLAKTTNDLVVYMPKSWIKYFGYNLTDIKSYFNFLGECNINIDVSILGTKTLNSVYGAGISKNIALSRSFANQYIDPEEDCYEILIRGNNSRMLTYMHFILVRFLYSSLYWNIPFIAMKLKRNLPKASAWECLLLAHANENYDSYYSLTATSYNHAALPSAWNTPEKAMARFATHAMNTSFKLYNDSITRLRTAIREENYKAIQELINKYKDVN